MRFFRDDRAIAEVGSRLVSTILANNAALGLTASSLGLTVAVYDGPGAPQGFIAVRSASLFQAKFTLPT